MENVHGLLGAVALLGALLVVLRWILAGARRRDPPRGRSRATGSAAAWGHVGTRRRDLASTGSWQMKIR